MAVVGESGLERLRRLFRGAVPRERGMQELETRRRGLHTATEGWLSLLRELEDEGRSSDPRYEQYYQAYLRAKEQEKRADLDLFNVRQGLER